MSSALSAGVTGLQAHQKMLDIAGTTLPMLIPRPLSPAESLFLNYSARRSRKPLSQRPLSAAQIPSSWAVVWGYPGFRLI